MSSLSEIRKQIKQDILGREGLTHALKCLKGALPEDTPKYDVLLLIEREYNELKLKQIKGTVTQEEADVQTRQLEERLLQFLTDLDEADLSRETAADVQSRFTDDQEIRHGHVLYQIPHRMQLMEESRCLVRIAFDEARLVEDLDIDEDTRFKEDIRISDYMKVELEDPSIDGAFEIKARSEEVQVIDVDDFTEWRFTVRPIKPGEHILELKVTIMLMVDGVARPRERTLEESVVIVAEAVPEEELKEEFKSLGDVVSVACGLAPFRGKSAGAEPPNPPAAGPASVPPPQSAPAPAPVPRAPAAKGGGMPMSALMTALAGIALVVVAVFLLPTFFSGGSQVGDETEMPVEGAAPPELNEEELFAAAQASGSITAYQEYLQEYPQGPNAPEAAYTIARLDNTPETWLAWLEAYPQSDLRPEALSAFAALEEPTWEKARLQATPASVNRYRVLYPDGRFQAEAIALQRKVQNGQPAATTPASREELLAGSKNPLNTIADSPRPARPQTGAEEAEPPGPGQQRPASPGDTAGQRTDVTPAPAITDPPAGNPVRPEPELPVPPMIRVPGGTFLLGCDPGQTEAGECNDNEMPARKVRLDDFYIGQFEVTNREFLAFLQEAGNNTEAGAPWYDASRTTGGIEETGEGFRLRSAAYAERPVVYVTWFGARAYAEWLAERTGRPFRLPTEAEWEYAARGGQQSRNYRYPGANSLKDAGWFNRPEGSRYPSVKGKKVGNELGIYDMGGNVWEWVADWYAGKYYSNLSDGAPNPRGPNAGQYKVKRGGSWYDDAEQSANTARVSNRNNDIPTNSRSYIGFRVATD